MKGLLLLSGGIDSPVAGHLMLQEGVEIVAVHLDARPHSDDAGFAKAKSLASKLGVKLIVVPNAAFHEAVSKNCKAKLHCILCKRFMYRVAEALASREGAQYVVTGESLGQVASQTLANLGVLSQAIETPVLRPLIGFDKEDAIAIGREIGTFELSSAKAVGCPFVPHEPSTKARLNEILSEESKIDIRAFVDDAVSRSQVV